MTANRIYSCVNKIEKILKENFIRHEISESRASFSNYFYLIDENSDRGDNAYIRVSNHDTFEFCGYDKYDHKSIKHRFNIGDFSIFIFYRILQADFEKIDKKYFLTEGEKKEYLDIINQKKADKLARKKRNENYEAFKKNYNVVFNECEKKYSENCEKKIKITADMAFSPRIFNFICEKCYLEYCFYIDNKRNLDKHTDLLYWEAERKKWKSLIKKFEKRNGDQVAEFKKWNDKIKEIR